MAVTDDVTGNKARESVVNTDAQSLHSSYYYKNTAAVCASAVAAAGFSAGAQTKYIRGDSDGNGSVEISDVTLAQRVLADIEEDSNGNIALRSDVNKNGFDINDATHIQRYLAEFYNTYDIGKTVYSGSDEYELPFIPD